jgi:hypothetical protein
VLLGCHGFWQAIEEYVIGRLRLQAGAWAGGVVEVDVAADRLLRCARCSSAPVAIWSLARCKYPRAERFQLPTTPAGQGRCLWKRFGLKRGTFRSGPRGSELLSWKRQRPEDGSNRLTSEQRGIYAELLHPNRQRRTCGRAEPDARRNLWFRGRGGSVALCEILGEIKWPREP